MQLLLKPFSRRKEIAEDEKQQSGISGFYLYKRRGYGNYQPLAGSFAILKCDGKYLMCYNVWRKQWEFPAGRREGNETPKECAIRELHEETGQKVTGLELKGVLKTRNITTGELKYNPVYFTAIEKLDPFLENEEISEIKLWDTQEEIGYVDAVDVRILEFV